MPNDVSPMLPGAVPAATRGPIPGAPPTVPGILLNTLPKSGSIYIVTALRQGLGLHHKNVSLGYFPTDLADWQAIKALHAGGMIAQTHLNASPANLQIFEHYLDRWIVHVRDPRQALLSWVHHLAKIYVERGHPAFESCPASPVEYYGWSLGKQIDWQIGVYLPQAVRWIEDWLHYAQTMRSKVLITCFEDLVRSEPIFMRTILDFLGVPQGLLRKTEVKKTAATHFRMGKVDEWAEVFTPDQARSATRLIPDTLFREFRWRA